MPSAAERGPRLNKIVQLLLAYADRGKIRLIQVPLRIEHLDIGGIAADRVAREPLCHRPQFAALIHEAGVSGPDLRGIARAGR